MYTSVIATGTVLGQGRLKIQPMKKIIIKRVRKVCPMGGKKNTNSTGVKLFFFNTAQETKKKRKKFVP